MSSENQVISDASQQTTPATAPAPSQEQIRLVDAVIYDQNIALNVIVGFIGVAQKRGCFAIDESAKIYECIKMFQGMQSSN
jgi:hypothetical protein